MERIAMLSVRMDKFSARAFGACVAPSQVIAQCVPLVMANVVRAH